jgi:hypothetical protein
VVCGGLIIWCIARSIDIADLSGTLQGCNKSCRCHTLLRH